MMMSTFKKSQHLKFEGILSYYCVLLLDQAYPVNMPAGNFSNSVTWGYLQRPLLLSWVNFNLSMEK